MIPLNESHNFDEVCHNLKEIFPFENYVEEHSGGDAYQTVFSIATQYLPKKSNVLYFGSGPCDKTANPTFTMLCLADRLVDQITQKKL